jgi:methyl-accepting chemotaxis protein
MSEFSSEDRQRILAEVRRNIERADAAANTALEARLEARLVAKVAQLVDQRFAELCSDLADVVEAVGKLADSVSGAIDDLRNATREPVQAANHHVEALLERLDRKLEQLTPLRANDDEVIDLPNPLIRHIN